MHRSPPLLSNRACLRLAAALAFAAVSLVAAIHPLAAQVPDSAAIAALAKNPAAVLPFDPRARMRTLPNGLRYYIRANSRPAKRAELRLVVNAGSIVEDDDQLGLAHVVEHMAFDGTRNFAKQQIVDFIERAGMTFGADLNAGTSFDETVYQLQLPSDTGNYVGRGLDWFSDIIGGGVVFDSVALAKERPVVIEEWRLGKGALDRIQQKQLPVLFRESRYATRLPIGTKESLDGFTRDRVTRFYADWYRPDLAAVIVVGDVNPDAIEAMIRAKFGGIPPALPNARPRDIALVPAHPQTLVAVATDVEAPESDVGILWKQPVRHDSTVEDYRREVTEQFFVVMLNQRYDEIAQKANAPFVAAGAAQGRLVRSTESFSLSATVQDASGIEAGLLAVLTEAERVHRHGFTATEFSRAKTKLARELDIQYAERDKTESGTYAARYVDHFLSGGPLLGIEVRSPLIRTILPTISLADVNAAGARWMTDAGRVILASTPSKPGITIPTDSAMRSVLTEVRSATIAAYTDVTSDAALVAAPPAPGKIVSERKLASIGVTEWTLSNGAHVLVKPTDFQADEVLIDGVSLGGVAGLPADRYYSAVLGPLMLERGGAGSLDAESLRKQLVGKVAAVSASVDQRTESVGGSASPRDFETFFELLWARTQTPRVDSAAVTALKQQYIATIGDRGNDPGAVFADTVGQTMYQHHPLAQPLSVPLIQSLDVQTALSVFRDRFRDFSDFTFVIVGSTTTDAVKPFVEQWIASLPGGGRHETPVDPGIVPPTGAITKVVHKGVEPKASTAILLTGKTPWSRDAALRATAINEILDIRMRETLREDLGGTYNVGVSVGVDRWPEGRFTTAIGFGAAPARIDSLANVAMSVLRKFAADGPTAAELAKVRENLKRARETAVKQNAFWQQVLEERVLWGDDPEDNMRTFDTRVATLDAESIRALARIVMNETNIARFTLLPER